MLRGFMQTAVNLERELVNRNALTVRDVHAEDDAALAALLGYLGAQRDQFERIVIESQDDAFFLAAAGDPRDGSDALVAPPGAHRVAETGLGMMYRVLDVERAFAHLPAVEAPFALRIEVDGRVLPADPRHVDVPLRPARRAAARWHCTRGNAAHRDRGFLVARGRLAGFARAGAPSPRDARAGVRAADGRPRVRRRPAPDLQHPLLMANVRGMQATCAARPSLGGSRLAAASAAGSIF